MTSNSEGRARRAGKVLREPEVCVVGGGPAGLTLAHALGRAGRSVVLLESGSASASRRNQELNDGDVTGEAYAGLRKTRHRGIGGTSNVWNVSVAHQTGAKYAPLAPRDLRSWPIEWSELEPFYREAQEVCGLGPFEYSGEAWAGDGRRPFDLEGTGLTNSVYQFGPASRFSGELMAEIRGMENVHVVASSTAVRLLPGSGGAWVAGVRAVGESGDSFDVRAGKVVLACGAVENARLLLLAGPEGQVSDWLGQGFMEHARDFSLSLVPESPDLFANAAFYDFHAAPGGVHVGGRIALSDDALARYDLPNASLTLVPRSAAGRRPTLLKRVLRRLGVAAPPGPRDRYGWSTMAASGFSSFGLVLNLEHLPDRRNRVELGNRVDRFGNRLPRVHLRWSDEEQLRLERLRHLLDEWFRRAGLGRLRFNPGRRPDLSAHHHAGTTRMAARPEDGVVDPDGRVFGLNNLYMAGASLLPTAGFANPTLTIVALARRLTRHLAPEEG